MEDGGEEVEEEEEGVEVDMGGESMEEEVGEDEEDEEDVHGRTETLESMAQLDPQIF